jgi:hypothetical protein
MMVEDNEPEQVKRVPELIALSYFHFSLSNTPARVETKTHTRILPGAGEQTFRRSPPTETAP